MKTLGVMRFVLFGAGGFGIGWALLGALGGGFPLAWGVGMVLGGVIFSGDFPALLLYTPVLSLGGAFGGAMLGLAYKDFRRVLILAVLGAVGFFFRVIHPRRSLLLPVVRRFRGYGILEHSARLGIGTGHRCVVGSVSPKLQGHSGTGVDGLGGIGRRRSDCRSITGFHFAALGKSLLVARRRRLEPLKESSGVPR